LLKTYCCSSCELAQDRDELLSVIVTEDCEVLPYFSFFRVLTASKYLPSNRVVK